ncbi:hypothetical protein Bxe_C1345 [Paraburkholderia xenovorans LB400]|uniref:Uncharacterized protein n=2 Tax=Paraburkholderia xenovorans TaxID=36873 RepID=Q13FE4_PARXL|nr:hypothetical protein Bxe_C1345 [Paraburkholderia xenovorans LB400]
MESDFDSGSTSVGYLACSAVLWTAWPPLEISSPAPATVLQPASRAVPAIRNKAMNCIMLSFFLFCGISVTASGSEPKHAWGAVPIRPSADQYEVYRGRDFGQLPGVEFTRIHALVSLSRLNGGTHGRRARKLSLKWRQHEWPIQAALLQNEAGAMTAAARIQAAWRVLVAEP